MIATQIDLEGHQIPATGNKLWDQLAMVIQSHPEARDDNTWLKIRWLQEYGGVRGMDDHDIYSIINALGKADIDRRRREMAATYPSLYGYSGTEQERRKKASKAGPRRA